MHIHIQINTHHFFFFPANGVKILHVTHTGRYDSDGAHLLRWTEKILAFVPDPEPVKTSVHPHIIYSIIFLSTTTFFM